MNLVQRELMKGRDRAVEKAVHDHQRDRTCRASGATSSLLSSRLSATDFMLESDKKLKLPKFAGVFIL